MDGNPPVSIIFNEPFRSDFGNDGVSLFFVTVPLVRCNFQARDTGFPKTLFLGAPLGGESNLNDPFDANPPKTFSDPQTFFAGVAWL